MNNPSACFRFHRWLLLAVAVGSATAIARGAIIQFDLVGTAGTGLLPGNETPAVTGGTGGEIGAGITYDDATRQLTLNVGWGSSQGFTDLSSAANNSHIHGPTAANFGNDGIGSFRQTAGVLFNLTRSGDAVTGGFITPNTITLTAEQETNLLNGRLYINLHTANNGGGEMRGFLVPAAPVLAIDFNDRSFGLATNTPDGFDSFLIGAVGTSALIQTAATVRAFGPYTVTVSGTGATPGYDDRLRTTPTNSPTLTQAPLYRDFVFSSDTGSGGLNVTVAGLAPNQAYRVTGWSFDQGTTGGRVSDWSANGTLVVDNYFFNGSTLPTANDQYQFSFKVSASPSGQILLQGRRDASSPAGLAVFLNALKIEITTPDAPTVAASPAPVELYAGDNASFTASFGGTAPFDFQWRRNGSPIPGATNGTLGLTNCQSANAGNYTLVASNSSGSVTTAPAALVVLPVTQLASGMLAYWPLDSLTATTPDMSGGSQHLNATNVDNSNLIAGQRGNAVFFNGNDEFLTRTNGPGDGLPAYAYPAYTVMMWVKGYYTNQLDRRVWCESANTNNNPLMTLGTDAAGTNGNVDVFIRNNNGATPHNHRKSTATNAFDGNWHHIAWVDNNGAARLYVDGVLDATDFSYARGLLTPNLATLGAVYRTTNIAHFNGAIDDAAVWRRSLSQAEIQRFMAGGTGPLTLVVTSAADDGGAGTLRSVIASALAGDTITFSNSLSGQTILLGGSEIVLGKSLTIDASALPGGVTISGNNASRILFVNSGTTNALLGLTLTGGNGVGAGFNGEGGAIQNRGTLALTRCTLSANSAGVSGGAIFNNAGSLTLTHCTFSTNTASLWGGALALAGGSCTASFCTFAHNRSLGTLSGIDGGGAIDNYDGTSLTLRACLLAGNTAATGTGPDLWMENGPLSATYCLVGNGADSTLVHGVNGNRVGTGAAPLDAKLAPLGHYGGTTQTMPPLGGSPALDAGDPLFSGLGLTDQRGHPRVANSRVDIGAVESCLLAYYTFDNSSAADASAASVAAYQGFGAGSWWSTDHRGQDNSAISLNEPGSGSTDEYYLLTTPHDPTNAGRGLGLKGDFTVSAWVHPSVLDAGDKMVLGSTGPGGDGTLHLGLRGSNIHFGFWANDITGNLPVPVDAWTHLAWTYNTHGGQMACYVNGLLAASAVGRVNTLKDANLTIGFVEGIPGSYFQGRIDELAVFCEALSPSQIVALANPLGPFPNSILPEPVLSPGLAAPVCGWNVRELYAHTGNPALMPYDLPSALHIANTPGLGSATNYTTTVINRRDAEPGGGFGFFPNDAPFAANNRTPQGLINGDDNYFALAARTVIHVAEEDDYTFGFSTDDGAQLRIVGAVFGSSTALAPNNPANPAHRGDTLSYPANTGDSITLGVAHLLPGSYEVEFIMWELGGGAFAEVLAARGAKTALDADFRLLSPGLFAAPVSLTLTRPSPTQIAISWPATTTCLRLQSALDITGPWTDVPGFVNGGTLIIGPGAQFFRAAE